MHRSAWVYVVNMSLNALFKFTVITVWLVAAGWLIRFEAFPHLFDETMQGYRELSKHLPAMRDSWMRIMAGDEHVGYVNSSIEMMDAQGEEQLVLSTQLQIRIQFQGDLELLRLDNKVTLDARQELLASLSTFSMGPFEGSLSLTPAEDSDKFEMAVQFNDLKFVRSIDIPEGAVISSPLLDAGLRAVKVGRTVKIRSMDPFSPSGDLRTMEITGLSTSSRRLPGETSEVEVTRVKMKVGELVLHAEVDEYGRIVQQDTPFGITFVLSESGQAMKVPKGNALDPSTLLSSSSLPSYINLPGTL